MKKMNNSLAVMMGASNHSKLERIKHDYYATEPKAVELLLELETFNHNVWECACGEGHISKVLEEHGYEVISTDLIDRGYGSGGIDFLTIEHKFNGDIITNPPYNKALEFVEQALNTVENGNKVAMFLKIQFLESQKRRKFFEENPPKRIYVSSNRLNCVRNGEFEKYPSSAICFAWFIWEKGYKGETTLKWFN